jgi:hypothetical protein
MEEVEMMMDAPCVKKGREGRGVVLSKLRDEA